MSQIKVIITKDRVYTTFYKTIHFNEVYNNDQTIYEDRFNDLATVNARSVAFSLACSDFRSDCAVIDWSDKTVNNEGIFDYLNECHNTKH